MEGGGAWLIMAGRSAPVVTRVDFGVTRTAPVPAFGARLKPVAAVAWIRRRRRYGTGTD